MIRPNFTMTAFRATIPCMAVALCCAATQTVSAAMLYTATGNNPETGDTVSGTAKFAVIGMELTVTLTNTSASVETNGNVLVGILFNSSITPLSYVSAKLPDGDTYWTNKTTSIFGPADWSGNWTDSYGVTPPAQNTGAAATGFAGTFMNPSRAGADYGIVSSGTYPQSGGGPGNPNKFPLAEDLLVLTFSSASSLEGLIVSDVQLLYGTDGTGRINMAPEPSSLWLAWAGLWCLGGSVRRWRH